MKTSFAIAPATTACHTADMDGPVRFIGPLGDAFTFLAAKLEDQLMGRSQGHAAIIAAITAAKGEIMEEVRAQFQQVNANLTEVSNSLTAAMQRLDGRLDAMQSIVDAATANDEAQETQIAQLQVQLDAARTDTTEVLAGLRSINTALTGFDQQVDTIGTEPAPPAP
jgi:chromosome segregation ATPase